MINSPASVGAKRLIQRREMESRDPPSGVPSLCM
jgi:hypothetical protein